MEDKKKQYPEGHFVGMWIGIGMAMFSGFGVAIGVALENMAFMGIGPAIGVAFGAGIGASIEAQKKKEGLIREMTDEEKSKKKSATKIGIALVVIAFIVLLSFYLVHKLR